jgi:nicotinamide-nucleotide amidase
MQERTSVVDAKGVMDLVKQKRLTVITAESCTCGMLAARLSQAEGASQTLHGGFVTYTKANKTAALGVPADLLERKTAVCEEVARAMAEGALARSPADLAVAITGVAGPEPDPDGNPVGLVHIAAARRGHPTLHVRKDYGDRGREQVLEQAMSDALSLLREAAAAG